MQARTFKQGALGNSFRKAPVGSSIQAVFEAFPEIEQFGSFVSNKVASLTSEPSDGSEERELKQAELHRAKAAWEVHKFCNNYATMVIEPTENELRDMWATCAGFPPAAVTTCIYDQLASWGRSGDLDWQPRLRALCLLEHMLQQPGPTHGTACAAVDDLRQLLRFLSAEVPQCKGVACRLVAEGLVYDIDKMADSLVVPFERFTPQLTDCKPIKIDCPDEELDSLPSTNDDFDEFSLSETEGGRFVAI